MRAESLDIPLAHGLAQQIDPKLMPSGYLKRAENVRLRKDGRWGKRNGYTTLAAPGSGPLHALAELGEQQLVASDGLLQARLANGTYKNAGSLTRFLPGKEEVVVGTSSSVYRHGCSAYNAGYLGTIVVDTTSTNNIVHLRVQEYGSSSDVYRARVTPAGTVAHARVVMMTDKLVFLWLDGTTLKHRVFTLSTLTAAADVNVATVSAASSGFDASEFTGGASYLLVWKNSATTLRIALADSSGTTSTADITTANTVCRATIQDCTERIYTAWVEESTTKIRCISHTTALGSPSAIADLTAALVTVSEPKPVIVRSDSTHAMVFWSDNTTIPAAQQTMYYRTVSNAAALGTTVANYSLFHASKPFLIGDQIYLWVASGETALDFTHHLVSLDTSFATVSAGSFLPQLTFANARAASFADVPDVAGAVYATPDGYMWGAHVVSSRALSLASAYVGFSNVRFHRGGTARLDRRQAMGINGTLYLSGGELAFFDGEQVSNLGFCNRPFIQSAADGGVGGGLTPGANYSWAITFEFTDARGQRHQSEPSAPVLLALPNSRALVTFRPLALGQYGNQSSVVPVSSVVAVLWRTLANGTVYYRVTDAVLPAYSNGSQSFIDVATDASIASNETLYTLGGVLPHAPAPACRYVALGTDRALVAGLWNPSQYQFSKLLFPGEPLLFAEHAAFTGFVQGAITAIACMDDVWAIFTEENIFLVSGSGPDDSGNGFFAEPRRLPSEVGCIDWRSVLEIPDGLLFQSARGIYLLPRGFGAPLFIGQTVADELLSYPVITSATLVVNGNENTARLTVTQVEDQTGVTNIGATLVLDLRTKQWTVDRYADGQAMQASALWGGAYIAGAIIMSLSRPLRLESAAFLDDAATAFDMVLELGDLRPFGLQGRGLVRQVQLLSELRSACTIKIEASYDTGITYADNASWAVTGVLGQQLAREWAIPRIQIEELRLRLSVIGGSSAEGAVFNALTLQVEPRRGARRFESGARA